MNKHSFKLTGLAAFVLTAGLGGQIARGDGLRCGSSILTSHFLNVAIAGSGGEYTLQQTLDIQTRLARHAATDVELQNAVKNGRTISQNLTAANKAELSKNKTTYIAVATSSSGEVKSGGTDLMVYDTASGKTMTKNVYTVNVKGDGAVRSVIKVDDFEALLTSR